MNIRMLSIISVLPAALASFAAPKATVTSFSQDAGSGLVSVSYTVDEKCIVTPEFFSAGEPVAHAAYADFLAGAINREVSAGTVHSFAWTPDAAGNGIDLSGKDLEVRLTAWSLSAPPPYMARWTSPLPTMWRIMPRPMRCLAVCMISGTKAILC